MKLRAYQRDAVAAVLTALTRGTRATLISATGTGKTIEAAAVARAAALGGRVLVVVPTLDLLAQTMSAWDAYGHGMSAPRVRRGQRMISTSWYEQQHQAH